MASKYEQDIGIHKENSLLRSELKWAKEKEAKLRSAVKSKKNNDSEYKIEIGRLNKKVEQLESFKITILDQCLNKMSEHEDILSHAKSITHLKRKFSSLKESNNEFVHTFAGPSMNQDSEINKVSKAETFVKTSELFNEFEPVPGFLRAITNEVVDMYDQPDSVSRNLNNQTMKIPFAHSKTISPTTQVEPKQPHSPAFYSSSDLLESKRDSSNS